MKYFTAKEMLKKNMGRPAKFLEKTFLLYYITVIL